MVVGGLKMEVGFLVDGLTAMMMCVVTFVSLMVHIYTIGYMEEDDRLQPLFAYISCSPSRCLMLVMSNNMLQLSLAGRLWVWCLPADRLLVQQADRHFANMKAFLVNRVGDFGSSWASG